MTQAEALEILKMGANVFLTGPAGSGKTYLINEYVNYLRSQNITAGITASTGIAATHINGRTIHSWSGLGVIDSRLDRKGLEKRFRSILSKEYLQKRYLSTAVLIIDEISMLSADYFDLVDSLCRAFRQSPLPMGGMQVVLCGDFFQLPPVARAGGDSRWVFESDAWRELSLKVCYLEEQHRHRDPRLIKILNAIRNNEVNSETVAALRSRLHQPVCIGLTPTKLFTTNADVDTINRSELNKIRGESNFYEMREYCKDEECSPLLEYLVKYCLSPRRLELKVGAVVMFIKNNFDDTGVASYVNGTLGQIIGFEEEGNYPIVETYDKRRITAYPKSWEIMENDDVLARIYQVPLRLAWAITVHKSQGLSLDEAVIDLGRTFEYGMGYVALSRVRSLDGIELKGLDEQALEINPEIFKLDIELRDSSGREREIFRKMEAAEIEKGQRDFIGSVSGSVAPETLF